MKTTVTFPANLLKAMRTYMVRENMGLHDQSKLVAMALAEFLEKRGICIDPGNELVEFEVEPKSDEV
jgi:hypothetical protein